MVDFFYFNDFFLKKQYCLKNELNSFQSSSNFDLLKTLKQNKSLAAFSVLRSFKFLPNIGRFSTGSHAYLKKNQINFLILIF